MGVNLGSVLDTSGPATPTAFPVFTFQVGAQVKNLGVLLGAFLPLTALPHPLIPPAGSSFSIYPESDHLPSPPWAPP